MLEEDPTLRGEGGIQGFKDSNVPWAGVTSDKMQWFSLFSPWFNLDT